MMTVLAIVMSIAGFYTLYNTSRRADLTNDALSKWLQDHRMLSQWLGPALIITSFIIFIALYGIGVGTLFSFVALMTSASLIILLTPLSKID